MQVAESKRPFPVLTLGGLAAILASTCCLAPLILVTPGFTGSWIGGHQVLELLRPVFIALAVASFWIAGRRIYRPMPDCEADARCDSPTLKGGYIACWTVATLPLLQWGFPTFSGCSIDKGAHQDMVSQRSVPEPTHRYG